MRLRHIEVFHAVYATGSISNAAKLLHVSQPSVSKVLHHAEYQLGYKLFERVKGKLIATDEGHQLFHQVSKVYHNIESLRRFAKNLKQYDKSLIRLVIAPAHGLDVIPEAIAKFLKFHPNATFDVETLHFHEVITSLIEQRADIGLVFHATSPHPGILDSGLGQGEFVCLAPKNENLPDTERIELQELTNKRFIRLNNKGPLGELLHDHFENLELVLNTVATVETYYIACKLVTQGVGVTIVDEITARSYLNESIQYRKLSPELNFHIKSLVLESRPLPLVCQDFLDVLRETFEHYLAEPSI